MHRTEIHVRWGELDPYNHVNHAVYSSYLEHARVAALGSLSHGLDSLTLSGTRIVVVRSDVQFKAPATAGDELVISTAIGELKGASMTWVQTITRNSTTIVEAEIHAACIGLDGRPQRMPSELRHALEGLRVG